MSARTFHYVDGHIYEKWLSVWSWLTWATARSMLRHDGTLTQEQREQLAECIRLEDANDEHQSSTSLYPISRGTGKEIYHERYVS